ncbi:MAG TPA: hypothetical protein VEQ37_21250 [Actinomycetota bacterium]|nr:hypothetical protein [Actinomycetota bacterium]
MATRTSGSEVRAGETDRSKGRRCAPARSLPGHGPDLRNSVVGVWWFIGGERYFHVDRVLGGLEGDLQMQAVDKAPKLGLR